MNSRDTPRPVKGPVPRVRFGALPPPHPRWDFKRVAKPFMYAKILEEVRETTIQYMKDHPEASDPPAALVAEFLHLSTRQSAETSRQHRILISRWLYKTWPDDIWDIHQRRVPDTYSDRQLWVVYRGTDPIRAQQIREERKREWDRRLAIARQKRADAAAAEAMKKPRVAEEQRRRLIQGGDPTAS